MRRAVPRPPVVLKPHEPVAERVLLPGDPGRALRLSQQLIAGPRMLNHHRGLWGYSGVAADGRPLTIQSTGLGGPSAAAVVAELVALGARRLIRVGTAAGLGDTGLGAVVIATAALAADGASRALGAGPRVEADAALTAALTAAAPAGEATPHREAAPAGEATPQREPAPAGEATPQREPAPDFACGLVASADIHDPVLAAAWAEAGVLACDLATAAVLAAARSHGVASGAVLGVTRAHGERLADDALDPLEAALGAIALAALAASGRQSARR